MIMTISLLITGALLFKMLNLRLKDKHKNHIKRHELRYGSQQRHSKENPDIFG